MGWLNANILRRSGFFGKITGQSSLRHPVALRSQFSVIGSRRAQITTLVSDEKLISLR